MSRWPDISATENRADQAAPLGRPGPGTRGDCPTARSHQAALQLLYRFACCYRSMGADLVISAGLDGFIVGLPVTSHGDMRDHKTDSIQVTVMACV